MYNVKEMLLKEYVKVLSMLVPKIKLRSFPFSASEIVVNVWTGEWETNYDFAAITSSPLAGSHLRLCDDRAHRMKYCLS